MLLTDTFRNVGRLKKGLIRYGEVLTKHNPVLVNLEVIKSCNATCHFCVCWKMDAGPRLRDYGPVAAKLKPVVLSINGGEPLLRNDICDIVRQVKPHVIYVAIITNGGLMTREKAKGLVDAGLDQMTFSLDYLSEQHDRVRGIPNLFNHITGLIPQIQTDGFKNIILNTIIMDSNLDEVVEIAKRAHEWGVKVNFSAYNSGKADNDGDVIRDPERQKKLREAIETLKELKKTNQNIVSSDYFFDHVPVYFENEAIGGCKAGQRWVTVTPDGYVQPCSETPRVCHYTEWAPEKFGDIDCDVCWYSCRAESQAPVTLSRVAEWIRK